MYMYMYMSFLLLHDSSTCLPAVCTRDFFTACRGLLLNINQHNTCSKYAVQCILYVDRQKD